MRAYFVYIWGLLSLLAATDWARGAAGAACQARVEATASFWADERGIWKMSGGAYHQGFRDATEWTLLDVPFTEVIPENIGHLGVMLIVEGKPRQFPGFVAG